MFKTVGQFIEELLARDKSAASTLDEEETRLATAALLVHAATIDGTVDEAETARLEALLKTRFSLSDEEVHHLLVAAERHEQEAVDLYRFTSHLKVRLGEDERLKLIEMMWEVAFADGRVDEFEDNLVWRTAELLGVSSRDRIRLKKQVEARQ